MGPPRAGDLGIEVVQLVVDVASRAPRAELNVEPTHTLDDTTARTREATDRAIARVAGRRAPAAPVETEEVHAHALRQRALSHRAEQPALVGIERRRRQFANLPVPIEAHEGREQLVGWPCRHPGAEEDHLTPAAHRPGEAQCGVERVVVALRASPRFPNEAEGQWPQAGFIRHLARLCTAPGVLLTLAGEERVVADVAALAEHTGEASRSVPAGLAEGPGTLEGVVKRGQDLVRCGGVRRLELQASREADHGDALPGGERRREVGLELLLPTFEIAPARVLEVEKEHPVTWRAGVCARDSTGGTGVDEEAPRATRHIVGVEAETPQELERTALSADLEAELPGLESVGITAAFAADNERERNETWCLVGSAHRSRKHQSNEERNRKAPTRRRSHAAPPVAELHGRGDHLPWLLHLTTLQ